MSSTRWLRRLYRRLRPRRRERVLGVELVNVCNLHCAYCLRDESMLYGAAQFLEPARLFDLLDRMPPGFAPLSVSLTGGEPLLHPRFGEVIAGLARRGVRYRVVTNGWHYQRVHDDLVRHRKRLAGLAFSLDGADASSHDRHRGRGSFQRVASAVESCRDAGLPFAFRVVLRRDTFAAMERIAVWGARAGAARVDFGAMLPSTAALHREWSLAPAEELRARRAAASLARVLRIPVQVSFGLHDPAPGAHCPALDGRSLNLDYRGRLTLCGNLSSFRGARGEADVPAAAATLGLGAGWVRIGEIGGAALRRRDAGLAEAARRGVRPDPILGSPCLSCLVHFGKLDEGLRAELLAS